MFGSQALETGIGLALMFFLLATAASAIAEFYAAMVGKRAKDLKAALQDMLSSGDLPAGVAAATPEQVEELRGTSEDRYRSNKRRLSFGQVVRGRGVRARRKGGQHRKLAGQDGAHGPRITRPTDLR